MCSAEEHQQQQQSNVWYSEVFVRLADGFMANFESVLLRLRTGPVIEQTKAIELSMFMTETLPNVAHKQKTDTCKPSAYSQRSLHSFTVPVSRPDNSHLGNSSNSSTPRHTGTPSHISTLCASPSSLRRVKWLDGTSLLTCMGLCSVSSISSSSEQSVPAAS